MSVSMATQSNCYIKRKQDRPELYQIEHNTATTIILKHNYHTILLRKINQTPFCAKSIFRHPLMTSISSVGALAKSEAAVQFCPKPELR